MIKFKLAVNSAMNQMFNGKYYRDANGRLTWEIVNADPMQFPELCMRLSSQLNLKQSNDLIVGPDQMFSDYTDGDGSVQLAWDVWSGFFATALSPASEYLVHAVADNLTE